MIPAWRTWLYRSGLVLGGSLLLYQAWTTYTALQQNTVRVSAPWLLLAGWGLIVLATFFQITAWVWIMRWLGITLSGWQLMRGYILPFLARYVPGSVWGYLSRGHWLEHNFAIPYATSNLSSVLEVLSLLVSASLIVCLYGITLTHGLLQLGLALMVLLSVPLSWWLWRRASRASFLARWGWERVASAVTLRRWLTLMALHVLLWVSYGGSVWVASYALGVGSPGGGAAATFAFSAAWLAGFLFVFVPAGLGVREVTLSSLLTAQLGLVAGVATTVSLIMRAFIILAEVAYIGLGLLVRVRRMADVDDQTERRAIK